MTTSSAKTGRTRRTNPRRTGAALVLILAMVVLLTVLVIAFLARAMSERQISESSAGITRVDTFATGALDIITADLRQEIATNSTVLTVGGAKIFQPTNAITPSLSGVTSTGPANLLKRSAANTALYPGGPSPASGISSTNVSRNGRAIALARWNKSLLLPKANPASASDFTPATTGPAAFSAPDWIFLTRAGTNPTAWANTLITTDSTNAVIGRYAFAIYNEGGLMDANVAGFPSTLSVTGPEARGKGAVAWADLTQLGLDQATIDALIAWRNTATGTSGTNYFNSVLNATNGFVTVSSSNTAADRKFISRQQLIRFLDPSGTNAPVQNALQYLGTFSRELHAPGWGPTANETGAAYQYKDNANSSTAANRFAPNVRMPSATTVTSYRPDGSPYTYTVPANASLIQRRFNLKRLNWLGKSGPQNGGTTANIKACFGLTWDPTNLRWIYQGSTGNTTLSAISTLDAVATSGREPNFFETLKAAILSGSIGLTTQAYGSSAIGDGKYLAQNDIAPFNVTAKAFNGNVAAPYSMEDAHIIQIGLNLIDQWDADSFPARILFGDFEFYGSENIPYVMRMCYTPFRPITDYTAGGATITGGGPDRLMINAWLEPVLWNPYRGTSTDEPAALRLQTFDAGQFLASARLGPSNSGVYCSPRVNPGRQFTIGKGSLSSLGQAVINPALARDLKNAGASVSGSNGGDVFTGDGANYAGFWMGEVPLAVAAPIPEFKVMVFELPGNTSGTYAAQGPRIQLLVDYGGGNYKEVQRFSYGLNGGLWISMLDPEDQKGKVIDRRIFYTGMLDPRTWRFGLQSDNPAVPYTQLPSPTQTRFWNPTNGVFTQNNANPVAPAAAVPDISQSTPYGGASLAAFRYADNSAPSPANGTPTYRDKDGVQRPGDAWWNSASSNTMPTQDGIAPATADYRPIMLNRAFRSVGEMGYAFRDLPFRSVDFSSPKSGDAALLDFFTLNEADGETGLVAGRIDLNTRQPAVLKAQLLGATRREIGPQTTLPASDADQIAQALVTMTSGTSAGQGPLANKSELVTRFGGNALFTASTNDLYKIKTQKEAAIRALAEVGQTRCWNLLIDLVAQVGRFNLNSTALDQFTVEGERRLWVHLAIDRLTGEVVDQQIEIVQE